MKTNPPLCSYTHLAFLLNSIIEQRRDDLGISQPSDCSD